MRRFDITRDQALQLWKDAPKSRKALIRYETAGFKDTINNAKTVARIVGNAADEMFSLFSNANSNYVPPVKDYPGIGRATGGLVLGPGSATSDSIPARLSNGEFVMRAASVKKYGTAFMSASTRIGRSEERRVGKEHGTRCSRQLMKNIVSVVHESWAYI